MFFSNYLKKENLIEITFVARSLKKKFNKRKRS